LIDPLQLTNDIAGNVALLALPALLWALLYLLAWEHGPFATSIGFGRRAFWLLLPGALLASLVLLPIAPVSNDWVAVSYAGALFPLLVATLAFERWAPPARRSVPLYLVLLLVETAVLLVLVVRVTSPSLQLAAVVAVAAVVPLVVGLASVRGRRALFAPVAYVLALTSGVLVFTFLASVAIPGVGIEESFPVYLLPPVGAGFVAAATAEWAFPKAEGFALPAAYASATFGVLIGADVLRQPPLYVAGAPAGLYAIGGAGVLDLVYLSGLLALGGAFLAHRAFGRDFSPVGTPTSAPTPTPMGRLGQSFRSGVDGRIDASLQDAASAGREAARQARRLLDQPEAPADRPWQGLPVPGWVVSDQANLDAVARAGSTDGREGFRGFLTARWLVLLGRELGLRRFGSVGARVAAFLLDLLIVTAPAVALWTVFVLRTPGSLSGLASNVAFNASVYGYAAIAFLYFALSETLAGRTLGKAVLGLRVGDRQLKRPGLSATLLRNVSKLPTLTVIGVGLAIAILVLLKSGAGGSLTAMGGLPVPAGLLDFLGTLAFVVGGVALLGSFGVLAILLTAERQRFGDLVAGTWVVRVSAPPGSVPPPSPAAPVGVRSG
jgi:uncharacterized RDD family membrane protein YckC